MNFDEICISSFSSVSPKFWKFSSQRVRTHWDLAETSKNFFLKNFSISESGFSQFLADFGGARLVLTSKSDSWRYFASDGQIFRSVGRLELILKTVTFSEAATGLRARATGKTYPYIRGHPLPPKTGPDSGVLRVFFGTFLNTMSCFKAGFLLTFDGFCMRKVSQNWTILALFTIFSENADFVKIVLPSRRNWYFSVSDPPKNNKTSFR